MSDNNNNIPKQATVDEAARVAAGAERLGAATDPAAVEASMLAAFNQTGEFEAAPTPTGSPDAVAAVQATADAIWANAAPGSK